MNRFLIPLALVVLVAGCAMPSLFGQQSSEAAAADSVQTVVVREIYHETPVYHVDTVYMWRKSTTNTMNTARPTSTCTSTE